MKSNPIARQLAEVHAEARALARLTGRGSAFYNACRSEAPTADTMAALQRATQMLCGAKRHIRRTITQPHLHEVWRQIMQGTTNEAIPLK